MHFGTFGSISAEKNDLSWRSSGAVGGIKLTLSRWNFVGNRCASAKKKRFHNRTIHGLDEKTRWLDFSVFLFGFGKVQYNQKLPGELPFPNHRSNDTNSVVTSYPCTFGGTRISENNPSSIFSKSLFWISMLVFGSVCRFIGGCHLEYTWCHLSLFCKVVFDLNVYETGLMIYALGLSGFCLWCPIWTLSTGRWCSIPTHYIWVLSPLKVGRSHDHPKYVTDLLARQKVSQIHVSGVQNPVVLPCFFVEGITLPNYRRIIICQYKNPYKANQHNEMS